MAESTDSEEPSNALIVQVDVHHRHCSQLSASIATTNNVYVTENQATNDLPSIDRGYPKTAAERMKKYRARKKKENPIVNHLKRKKSGAERVQECKARKKAKAQSAANNIGNLIEDRTIREQIQEQKSQSQNLVVTRLIQESENETNHLAYTAFHHLLAHDEFQKKFVQN
ncbi:hypothetical protein EVAR_102066_1 [Eumeta japonica]|uniref:Uncharacterized protein n=1 Tax=Eumeta variegata TaxID=151549 RepID=A0A4C1U002_EUMVA|nr:hypothetical protein EVAR_102066_1 [Eumeta japonica]